MSIDLDVLSKIVSSSHLSISKSRSTGLLFICAAHHLKLIKGHKRARTDRPDTSWNISISVNQLI